MKSTDLSNTVAGSTSLADIEEKIDKMLKYQKTVRTIAIIRGVFSFIFFMVFIVLPIIGSFYLFRFLRDNVDLGQISGQYAEFITTFDSLKNTTGNVGNLDELMNKLPGNGG